MHCPLNYGAILQTYALQMYLETIGINVTVIDYRPNYIVYDQSLMYVGAEFYRRNFITRWAYRFLKAPAKFGRKRKFMMFSKNELHLTPTYKTFEEIRNANLDADFFICGSDQIWNVVSGAHKDPAYFLEFAHSDSKKISYAASGNLPLTEEVRDITFPMINRISYISMREYSTIASIQEYINKKITHVCDPVLLLEDECWRMLYKKHSTFAPNEKYVLVYPMGNGAEKTIDTAYRYAKQKKKPLYMISASLRKDSRVSKMLNVSPYDFLTIIDHAEFVVTNSFHGTCFSIIFEKEFCSCVAVGTNQRIASILEMAGLSCRLSKDGIINEELIDYSLVKANIKKYIEKSKDFLKEATV